MPREGRRWIPVYCDPCRKNHGFTAGAMLVVIEAYQRGELITTGGTALCPLTAVVDHVPHSQDRAFDYISELAA